MNRLFHYFTLFFLFGIALAKEGKSQVETKEKISPPLEFNLVSNSLTTSSLDSREMNYHQSTGQIGISEIGLRNVTTEISNSSKENQIMRLRCGFSFQFNTSALLASLYDWKNQLYLPDGTHPSSTCMVFGGVVSYFINPMFEIGVGYEAFFTPQVNATKSGVNLDDQITGTFFYGSIGAGDVLESTPNLFLFGGMDCGILKAMESMENFGGINYDATGETIAYRLKTGAQYYTSESWSVTVEASYLLGKVSKISVSGQPLSQFTFNFNGIEFRGAVNYHIPL
jgi:hypothetical protein